ncbi:serine hydrolase [Winogradskyella sp. 3972H.M.0a.05]|uniref:serine hydrolase domain-containing protein n=1 Tax=Winogradskyella sp. 3972H.M.0a.05 TaxID=2950277 RepID=UPI00339AA60D
MFLKRILFIYLSFSISFLSCSQSDDSNTNQNTEEIEQEENNNLYFPPIGSNTWETVSLESINWNTSAIDDLFNLLDDNDTNAFIVLKDGKIAIEWYFGDFQQSDFWYWASAGKTLTAFTVGIAQQESLLNINNSSSDYLGAGWSSLTTEEELNIKVIHHITMTTGLDYTDLLNQFCTDWDCLTYLNEPGTFWYYHNAPYTLSQSIVTGAVGEDFEDYFNEKLKNRIGMNGFWLQSGYNNIYRSDARSMARFGLLCLNNGIWDDDVILSDSNYFEAMTTTSQNLNEAYGYLWWLNGQNTYRLPASTSLFNGKLIPNAPDDLVAGLGANDQKLYVVPSENLVVIRLGESANEMQLGPSGFDNMIWEKLNAVIN